MKDPILVLGANGFTGKFVCLELKKRNINFVANLRPNSKIDWMLMNDISFKFADINKKEHLKNALKGCSGILNISSIGFGNAPVIVKACEEIGIKRAVFISTTSIFTYLNTKSKRTRLEAEKTIINSNLDWTILRPTMIFGTTEDRNIIRLINWIYKYPLIPIFGNGKSLQQPVYVGDVAWSAVEVFDKNQTIKNDFNISGKNPLSYNSMIDIIANNFNKKIFKLHLPLFFFLEIFKIMERIGIKFFIKSEQIKRLNENKSFSYQKAKEIFNYNPLRFEEVIKKEISMYKIKKSLF